MSYKNNKSTGKFEGYKSNSTNITSSDALGSISDSHKRMDAAMEAGKQIGEAIRQKYDEHKASKELEQQREMADQDASDNFFEE